MVRRDLKEVPPCYSQKSCLVKRVSLFTLHSFCSSKHGGLSVCKVKMELYWHPSAHCCVSLSACVCVKVYPPIIPSLLLLCRLIPQTCHTSLPRPVRDDLRVEEHIKTAQTAAEAMITNHGFSLYLFSFLPWVAISFCLLIPAVPRNLAVHSPSPNMHFLHLPPVLHICPPHPVVHDKVSPVKREEINDGRRRMNVCPVRFIIQSFLYHFYTFGFTIELQSCPILLEMFKTWTSLFSLSYNSLSGAALQ